MISLPQLSEQVQIKNISRMGLSTPTNWTSPFSFLGLFDLVHITLNKRTLVPWVPHLRMTVYKGLGKHSYSQSPAMNFDRSAVSLRLCMDYVDKLTGTSTFLYISLSEM